MATGPVPDQRRPQVAGSSTEPGPRGSSSGSWHGPRVRQSQTGAKLTRIGRVPPAVPPATYPCRVSETTAPQEQDTSTRDTPSAVQDLPSALAVIALGIGAGFLSGLFGVGGGVIIVPALIAILGMERRRASATSLLSIILTASVGASVYGLGGQVSLVATPILVAGALIGTQIGVRLLRTLPERILPWTFVTFVVIVIVSQQFQVPVRDAELVLDAPRIAGLTGVGLLSGIFAGLVGVGGGSIIVPGLQLVVGVGDLLARGTSLLVMIPTAISGTWTNAKHHLVDIRTGLLVGLGAAVSAPLGKMVATWVSPRVGGILFSIFLVSIVINTIMGTRRTKG